MTSLLVVIDAQETEHAGLNRIKELPCELFHFQIDLYIDQHSLGATPSLGDNPLVPAETAAQANDKSAWLEMLVQPLRDLGYVIETAVVECEQLHESIIKRAVALGVDCILKPLRHHGLLRQLLFTATDWQLVRQCPLPLWLVSHFYQLSGKPILAAVDVAETDAEHLALNQRVLQQAVAVAVMLHGSLHMVNASGLTPLVGLAEPLAYDSAERFKLHQVAVALQVAASYQIEPERVHCEQGSVDRVINYWSHQIDAGIIVLGDTTRAGLRSLLGGGVAEAVMSKTDSDVLIVKPGSESLPIAAR